MSKLFANRSALAAASFIVLAAAVAPAAAQERNSGKDEPTLSAKLVPTLAPSAALSTSGAAPRRDEATRAPAPVGSASPAMPEMHIMDYSLVFPETADGQGGDQSARPPADPH